MYDWYEKAAAQLEEEYERGEISALEYRHSLRDLNSEYDDMLNSQTPEDYRGFNW